MNRVQYALAALVAVAGIGSAFTTNQIKSKSKSKLAVLYWYKPDDLLTTIITASFATADLYCPIYDPLHICLLGYTQRYNPFNYQLPVDAVTGWTH